MRGGADNRRHGCGGRTLRKLRILFEASPFLVHIFLVVSVIVYIVFGALMMQFFELPDAETDAAPGTSDGKDTIDDVEAIATWGSPSIDHDYSGADLASEDPNVHICIQRVLGQLMDSTKCNEHQVDLYILNPIDECYQNAAFKVDQKVKLEKPIKQLGRKGKPHQVETDAVEIVEDEWSFSNAVIFAFTVITTIGYGHVAPVTPEGRLFCIIYGLIGVPFTLLTIADIGMFLSRVLRLFAKGVSCVIGWTKRIRTEGMLSVFIRRKASRLWMSEVPSESPTKDALSETESEDEDERGTGESVGLFITFIIYLLLGAYLLSLYEPEMDYFKAFYFNFVTLTTIGLGDFVPRSTNYMFLTLVYITVGLALTTLAIEIAADYLKKLHYFGRKIEDVANAEVWFGGKKMSLKSLVRHLGDQLNIPVEALQNLNLDTFVDAAIKVEDGEIKTLRNPDKDIADEKPFSYRDIRKADDASTIGYADDRNSIVATYRSDMPPLAVAETSRTLATLREESISKKERFSEKDTMTIGSADETSMEDELIREVSMEPMPDFSRYV
uniref:Ion channel n=1 Tax=Steinernema glaseri TaxID=37863 RepID=A0A1I8AAQ9_9BILA